MNLKGYQFINMLREVHEVVGCNAEKQESAFLFLHHFCEKLHGEIFLKYK